MLLIVDADPSFLELAQEQLANGFREVLFAGDAEQARELLQAVGRDVAVALINLHLPGSQSGITLIQKLHATCPDIPLIAVAGHHDRKELERAKAAGAAEVLEKPITEEWRNVITRLRDVPRGI